MRRRHTTSSELVVEPHVFRPGQLVRETARRYGWSIGLNNLMVEGTTDESYLRMANQRYVESCGLSLIGSDFHVFAVGKLGNGGTDAINEKFNNLSEQLRNDPVDGNGNRIRVVALFDDDPPGRGMFSRMRTRYMPWSDIFLLRRHFPRDTRDSKEFEAKTNALNAEYFGDKQFFCEIEDLIHRSLIDLFVESEKGCLQREIRSIGNGFHCDLHGWAKGKLAEFVKQEAGLAELGGLVELLKTFRYLFDLPVEGSSGDPVT
ncbi:hypothetical protein [Schlesneria sp. T3-172]|uniref:hypothetical protein n=1 Tax=Schlesneria sphaerica TaxID=3373610 RepID=UPI0037C57CC3